MIDKLIIKNELLSLFDRVSEYHSVKLDLESNPEPIYLTSLYGTSKALFLMKIFQDFQEKSKNLIIIANTDEEAKAFYHEIQSVLKKETIFYFPQWDNAYKRHLSPSQKIIHHRIDILYRVLSIDKPYIFITSIINFITPLIDQDKLMRSIISLEVSKEMGYLKLQEMFHSYGYYKETTVIFPGSFAIRGSIIDFYPSFHKFPIRIEFFGNKIFSLREFDPKTQKSIKDISYVNIFPIREIFFDSLDIMNQSEFFEKILSQFRSLFFEEEIEDLKKEQFIYGLENFIFLLYPKSNLLEYFSSKDSVIFLDKENTYEGVISKYKSFDEKNEIFNQYQSYFFSSLTEIKSRYFSQFSQMIYNDFINSIEIKNKLYQFPFSTGKNYKKDFLLLKEELKNYIQKSYHIYIGVSFEERKKHILTLTNEIKIHKVDNDDPLKEPITVFLSSLIHGFISDSLKILVIFDSEILGKKQVHFAPKIHSKADFMEDLSFSKLNKNDYVVHFKYGIGKYLGLQCKTIQNRKQEYVEIEYADEPNFLFPIQDLPLIQKYIGLGNQSPKLDRISKKKNWEDKKETTKKQLEELAYHFYKAYLKRINEKGFQYPEDDLLQLEFEADFEYQETQDQLKSIREIKKDMCSSYPMDRLLCGDVGFGKTEVAMRIAFKAATAKKQVALLIPTTVLCQQHFITFKERFKNYPQFRIEYLSRLQAPSKQKLIIEDLKNHKIDIIIGTHRILSKDVHFKNLGLLIIDEEHRFGVKHKELLKQLSLSIDSLTMSATPIPRTLNMSIFKIRDISLIETPPLNRFPIKTYTMEWDESIFKEAVERELNRKGQCFFIFNNTYKIKSFASYLNRIISSVKIAYAHGKMHKNDLENILSDFIQKKYDILITTTIIESGMDIKNVNCIFIYNADEFGLTQLYQLRGRVGRSPIQAYCYLFYEKFKQLEDIKKKRFKVIEDYTDLGSGYHIAYRDMEIRGVGNVFGYQQSGSISNIGYQLFHKFLTQGVQHAQDKSKNNENMDYDYLDDFQPYINLGQDEYIPDTYILDQEKRLEAYRKIYQMREIEDIEQVKKSLTDQFGAIPKVVLNFIEYSKIRILAKKYYIQSIISYPNEWAFIFHPNFQMDEKLFWKLLDFYKGQIILDPKNELSLKLLKFDYLKKNNNENDSKKEIQFLENFLYKFVIS